MEPSHLPAVSSPFPGRCPLGARSRRQRAGAARVAPVEAPTVPRAGGAWGRLAPAGLPGVPAARGGVGGLEIARSPALRSPPPSPSDLAGHGQPRLLSLSLSLRAGGALRQWGKGVGCANSGRRDAPVHAASPQPPLPSACLPLWSLGLMN